jgi:hypothetical protein
MGSKTYSDKLHNLMKGLKRNLKRLKGNNSTLRYSGHDFHTAMVEIEQAKARQKLQERQEIYQKLNSLHLRGSVVGGSRSSLTTLRRRSPRGGSDLKSQLNERLHEKRAEEKKKRARLNTSTLVPIDFSGEVHSPHGQYTSQNKNSALLSSRLRT